MKQKTKNKTPVHVNDFKSVQDYLWYMETYDVLDKLDKDEIIDRHITKYLEVKTKLLFMGFVIALLGIIVLFTI